MFYKSELPFQWLPCCALLLSILFVVAPSTRASDCPTDANTIAADRPDVTNSSSVVPFGSLQVENGADWSVRYGSNTLDGTTTRLRLGVAHCTEFLIDVPSYFYSLNGPGASGFSDGVVSVKRQLPAPLGFDLSATAGLGFPSGSQKISGRGYQPYIQFPWSRELGDDWTSAGMFTVTWFRSDSALNATLEPTLSLERVFGTAADVFVEYVGDYDHQQPRQQFDGGGAWRFTKNQQLDFHMGFGLNRASVDHFFGIGYSFRLDGFFP